jgi:hypothetical protein
MSEIRPDTEPYDELHDERRDVLANEPGLRRPRRSGRLVAWSTVGVLAAAAVAGGGYAAAAGGGSRSAATSAGGSGVVAQAEVAAATPSDTPATPAKPRPRGGPGHPGLLGPHWGLGLGRVLHGEATVTTRDGTTRLVDVQRGTVTAVGGNTVTVTSSDNVSFSYVVNAKTRIIDFSLARPRLATVADLKKGDTVRVAANRSGDTRTATVVVEGTPKARPGAHPTANPNT